jgi:hypothetical protein
MKKPFTLVTVIILAIVALAHLLRLLFGWSVSVAGTDVPTWVSVIALIISATLAYGTWRENI